MSRISERIARMKEELRQLQEHRAVKVIIAPWARVEAPPAGHNATRIDDHHADHG